MLTIGQIILKSAEWLGRHEVESPRLDAELLLAHVLGCDRLRIYMDWDKPLLELEISASRDLIRRRGVERLPVARLTGVKEFYGRPFKVTAATFVPRPETEGLVDRAKELLAAEPALQVERPVVFEVGTGTGAIIVSLALETATPLYIASELRADTLAVAKENAGALHADARIEFRQGTGFCGYEGPLHLVVSNPPYIRRGDIAELPREVRDHDPRESLDGGSDGLDVVREILRVAKGQLVPGGCVLLELGEDHEEEAMELFADCGLFTETKMERDYSGKPRYAFGRRAAS